MPEGVGSFERARNRRFKNTNRCEFSREKNVTQREVMEAALVEYLQKYGFKREIEALLKNQ